MRAPLLFVVLGTALTALFAGCSGTSASPVDGGGGDGGCITPTAGASCSSNDVACQPPGDICCVGYSWMCQNGAWVKAGVGCACQVDASVTFDAGPFKCGSSATCISGTEFCVDQAAGVDSGQSPPDGGTVAQDSYSCAPLPSACVADPTCACVTTHGGCPTQVLSCTETNGQVTVHCMGQ